MWPIKNSRSLSPTLWWVLLQKIGKSMTYCSSLLSIHQPRQWRRTLSTAVDAYRHIRRLEQDLSVRAMHLSPIEQLAYNCPRCFGAHYPNKRKEEPDFVVCIDGNFQHRRHIKASIEPSQLSYSSPPLFLPSTCVALWKPKTQTVPVGSHSDVQKVNWLLLNGNMFYSNNANHTKIGCMASMHTAADDRRGPTTWRGCDDTGLLGMACRHDHALAFVNIVQSGEK